MCTTLNTKEKSQFRNFGQTIKERLPKIRSKVFRWLLVLVCIALDSHAIRARRITQRAVDVKLKEI